MGVATAGLIVSAGISAYQIAKTEKDKNDAKRAINKFKRQELINPFESLQVSTLKSEQQTNANLSSVATSVNSLQRAGTRAVLGGIPKVNESSILLQNQISQDLEDQDRERQIQIAQGEENIRAIREGRETQALGGLGQSLQVARQDQATAVGQLFRTGAGFAELYANGGNGTSGGGGGNGTSGGGGGAGTGAVADAGYRNVDFSSSTTNINASSNTGFIA